MSSRVLPSVPIEMSSARFEVPQRESTITLATGNILIFKIAQSYIYAVVIFLEICK